jgi:hypothetical protein
VKDVDEAGRSVAEVRASLERSTDDFRSALERLELGARAKLDVGKRITHKGPMIYVAGFVAGMVIGMITARSRRMRVYT